MEKIVETTGEWIQTRTGIENRYALKGKETLRDIAIAAGQVRGGCAVASVLPARGESCACGFVVPAFGGAGTSKCPVLMPMFRKLERSD